VKQGVVVVVVVVVVGVFVPVGLLLRLEFKEEELNASSSRIKFPFRVPDLANDPKFLLISLTNNGKYAIRLAINYK
jgi:hypothetical protein